MNGDGAGRRLSADEEGQAAALFADGASDRQVAEVLKVGNGTANRLRHRLAARIAELAAQDTAPAEDMPPEPAELQGDDVAELGVLRDLRDGEAEAVRTFEERAEVSRSAVTQLELERREALRAGRDAAPFRARMANARADADDAAEQAGYARERLAATDRRIAEITERQELAVLRAELDTAVAERDAVYARSGDRQRAAVAAVRGAAEDFCATFAEEDAAAARVAALAHTVTVRAQAAGEASAAVPAPAVTHISPQPDALSGPSLALTRAIYRAREGKVQEVSALLGEAFGWLPASPEEIAADMERIMKMRDAQLQAQQQQAARSEPWTREDTSHVPLDADGREIRYWPGYRPPVHAHPLDSYRAPGLFGGAPYDPGYRFGG